MLVLSWAAWGRAVTAWAWRLVMWAGLGVAGAARADTITVRADEWCPYNCAVGASAGDGRPGYGIEVAREIFAAAGHHLDYALSPWTRSLEDCLHGTIDAVIGAAPVDSPDLVFPAEPIGVWDTTFVVRKGDPWRYDGAESLDRVKIAGILGYIYREPVNEYLTAHRKQVDLISGQRPLDQNLRKLVARRIDTTMESRMVLDYKLKVLGLADRLDFAGGTPSGPIYIAFSPKNPGSRAYADLLDQGIRRMRASGRLAEILASYGLRDWGAPGGR